MFFCVNSSAVGLRLQALSSGSKVWCCQPFTVTQGMLLAFNHACTGFVQSPVSADVFAVPVLESKTILPKAVLLCRCVKYLVPPHPCGCNQPVFSSNSGYASLHQDSSWGQALPRSLRCTRKPRSQGTMQQTRAHMVSPVIKVVPAACHAPGILVGGSWLVHASSGDQ